VFFRRNTSSHSELRREFHIREMSRPTQEKRKRLGLI